MWKRIEAVPAVMVPWYLMLSWLYYHLDISLVPDEDYNKLCLRLLRDLPGIEHPHKKFIDAESLQAGTGYALTDYPMITMAAATRLAIEDKHLKWNKKRKQWEPVS